MKLGLIILLLTTLAACKNKQTIITIIDTGQNDRITLGKQLRIINNCAPRLVALDFLLVPDSLGIDSILVKEIGKAKTIVLAAGLHEPLSSFDMWDSLELSHVKFKGSAYGFVNFSEKDSIILRELPMMQFFRGQPVYSFSYVVAENSFGVKSKYKNRGSDYLDMSIGNLKNYKLITSDKLFSGQFDKSDLENKIVIMGYLGQKEDFLYIDKKSPKVNGVEIHAAFINELVDR
jgi:CHASE2 domain-containing sensor protein